MNRIAERFGSFAIVVFVTLCAYIGVFIISLRLPGIFGVDPNTLWALILAIILTSMLSFFSVLVLQYIFQKVRFLDEILFLRYYHGVHHLYIYGSGLIGVLYLFEPLLLQEGIISSGFNSNYSSIIGCIFFIVLSNYGFYNSFVMSNEFNFFISKEGDIILSITKIIVLLSIIVGLLVVMRFFILKDELSILILALITGPWMLNDMLKKIKQQTFD